MKFLLEFVISWLPLLLVILSCAWMLLKRNKGSMSASSPADTGKVLNIERRRTVRIAGIALLALLTGITLGYAGKSWEINHTTPSLPETMILNVLPDGTYTMMASDGTIFNTTFCSGPEALVKGNKLKEFKFMQRTGCKDIHGYGLGYVAYSQDGVNQLFPIPTEVSQNVR
jgi:hypothetical protein